MTFADGNERGFARHARQRMLERGIIEDWVVDILANWVAKRWDEVHQSMNYYGFVEGSGQLLKVAVSGDDSIIYTAHFDTAATRRYHQRRDFFDEVKDDPAS